MSDTQKFHSHMPMALAEARKAAVRGEVPVGAVLLDVNGKVLASAGNETRARHDPTAHAEILVIRAACQALSSERLSGSSLWVTLEPCAMCAAAVSFARIENLFFGASDPKSGAVLHGPKVFSASTTHHKPHIFNGIDEVSCGNLLTEFFAQRR